MAKTIATIVGIVFVLAGFAGFVAPRLLGAHLSFAHSIIHLFSGAVSLYFGLGGTLKGARAFCLVFGILYLLLGIAGFVAGTGPHRNVVVIPKALILGTVDHIIHVALGALFLIGGISTRSSTTP